MSDPTVSDLAHILADDTTMGTRLEVAWLEDLIRLERGEWSRKLVDERRFVGAVRYNPERNVIELVCCPPTESHQTPSGPVSGADGPGDDPEVHPCA